MNFVSKTLQQLELQLVQLQQSADALPQDAGRLNQLNSHCELLVCDIKSTQFQFSQKLDLDLKQIQELKIEIAKANQMLRSLTANQQDLIGQNTTLSKMLQHRKLQIVRRQTQLSGIVRVQHDKSVQHSAVAGKVRVLKQERGSLELQCGVLGQKLSGQYSALRQLDRQIKELQLKNLLIDKEIKSAQQDSKRTRALEQAVSANSKQLEERLTALQLQNNSLKASISGSLASQSLVQQQVDSLHLHINNQEFKSGQLGQQLKQLQQAIVLRRSQIESKRVLLAGLNQQQRMANHQYQKLRREIVGVDGTLMQVSMMNQELRQQLMRNMRKVQQITAAVQRKRRLQLLMGNMTMGPE